MPRRENSCSRIMRGLANGVGTTIKVAGIVVGALAIVAAGQRTGGGGGDGDPRGGDGLPPPPGDGACARAPVYNCPPGNSCTFTSSARSMLMTHDPSLPQGLVQSGTSQNSGTPFESPSAKM